MAIGAVPVPTYTTNAIVDHAHILRDSGAVVAIAGSHELANKLITASGASLRQIYVINNPTGGELPLVTDDGLPPDDIMAAAVHIPSDQLACLIYTSGTSGLARGVMLPHRSILSNIAGVEGVIRALDLRDEIYLSFLPASHSFEHTVGQFLFPANGVEVAYATGIEHLADNMLAIRPTIMTVVPRILEVIKMRILAQAARANPVKRALFKAALDAGLRRSHGKAKLTDKIKLALLDPLVLAKVRARFGGRLRILVSGGARLAPETGNFYRALGFVMLQGYGQTEAGPVITVNCPPDIRVETVGRPLTGVELRIADDGEILVRGELVMRGYWNRPEATAQTIQNGWLHTGDIGVIDTDGHLRITDRKKDIIVLSGGENISPAYVESVLAAEQEIAQVVVAGEGKASLTALIVPREGVTELQIRAAVQHANRNLSSIERIRKHLIVDPFTIENGLLTPTQKIRRALVIEQYRAQWAGADLKGNHILIHGGQADLS